MSCTVSLTGEALEDLTRIEDFLIDRALQHVDFDLPARAMDAIRSEFGILQRNPYTCRMADANPLERELIIPFSGSVFVALFEIISEPEVVVLALRHQREDDFH